MLVVVDALDECEDKNGIATLVSIISNAYHNPSFPLRFLFTSRAYDYICSKFADSATEPLTIPSNLRDWKADDDIRRFLRDGFREIRVRRKRVMGELPDLWPSDSDLHLAVMKSEGLFIWASTVLKFVGSERGLPQRKLNLALNLHPGLDYLYRQVIEDAPRENPFYDVIGAITLLRIRFPARNLSQLLGIQVDEVLDTLQGLEPILDIPEEVDEPIQPYHASLHDFLTDRDRSMNFYINPAKQHFSIMLLCLEIIAGHTQWGTMQREVTDYACRNLFHHFKSALAPEGIDSVLSWQPASFRKNLSSLGHKSLKPWFDVLLRVDSLSDSRHDLGVIILKLEEWPERSCDIVLELNNIKQSLKM
jgi:hypothetical protein